MQKPMRSVRSTVIAAVLSLPLAGAGLAQESQAADQTGQSTAPSQDTGQQQQAGAGQAAGDQQEDTLVASVGEAEIRGSDVMTVIGLLPPQLQSQPPQMLVPMAVEQLILRELILEEARAQNLAEAPEVVALVGDSAQAAEEDAMVQVWLDRQMAAVVTDEAVREVYEGARTEGAQDLPPIEEVRPQIEQYVRQQVMQDIQMRLLEGADVVFYDPTGRPMEQQAQGAAQEGQGSGDDGGEASAETPSTDGPGDGDSGSEEANEQTQAN